MEVRGGNSKLPSLGPGHLQQVPRGRHRTGRLQTQPPWAVLELIPLAAEAPLNVFIDSLVTSIWPRLLLLIKCPRGHSRQPDVILYSPALLPSVGHTAVIQASQVTEETLPGHPSQGVMDALGMGVSNTPLPCSGWPGPCISSPPPGPSATALPLYNLSPIYKVFLSGTVNKSHTYIPWKDWKASRSKGKNHLW